MTFLVFLGATAVAVVAFEIASSFVSGRSFESRLAFGDHDHTSDDVSMPTLNAWQSILAGLFPSWFHPKRAKKREDVLSLLRRAGYPWRTVGEFYVYAMKTFAMYTAIGVALGGTAAAMSGDPLLGVLPFMAFAFVGLRRPYSRLKRLTRERAEAMRLNMLPVLSALKAYLRQGISVQEALRGVQVVGGPFANMLNYLAARMQIESFDDAIAHTRLHVPDPDDAIVERFFDAVEAYFNNNRPLTDTVAGLLEDVRGDHADQTAERVALTKRQAVLFGVLAVVGMLITIIWPALG